ncbi:MAG TPA: hypothetical protein VFH46_13610 [Pyrinomonadaceae bacterium]|nr:hypothetical protein [Pyrinomonadaceae bacterium]
MKVEHLNFSSRPVFFPVHGGSVEGVTTVYARATHGALEAAVENLIEPISQVIAFERKAG